MGLIPVTGVTLSFISYGGSAVMTSFGDYRNSLECWYET